MACNLLLAAAKAVAGILGHSQAVLADALHSLTDSVTDIRFTSSGARARNELP